MHLSRTTIVSPIPSSEKLLLVQPLSGQVALLEAAEARSLGRAEPGAPLPESLPLADLHRDGFVVVSEDEERALVAVVPGLTDGTGSF